MKRLLSLCLVLCVFACLFVGCGNGNSNGASSVPSDSSQTVETTEGWNQICPDPIPDNKLYTVYCLPTSGVKAGVAADPATKVKSVDNIGNLYFDGFQNDSHIKPDNGTKPQNKFIKSVTEKQDNHLKISTFEFGGYVYDADYTETTVVTETITLKGQQKNYKTVLDKFSLEYWSEDQVEVRFADVILDRITGRVVQLTCDRLLEGVETTIESARKIEEAIFAELNGFDLPQGVELKKVNYGNYCDDYKVLVQGYSINGGYSSHQVCGITVGNYNELLEVRSYTNLQKYIDAIECYGKPAIDEAISVLQSSLDDDGLSGEFFLDFDGNGELYCRVYSKFGYNSQGCLCSTPKQYCVKVV